MSGVGNARSASNPDLLITLLFIVIQIDLSPITVLLVFAVDTIQL